MVSTVALRNTTGRPDGKELLFTAAFWLILLTSLCPGCNDAKQATRHRLDSGRPGPFPHLCSRVAIHIFKGLTLAINSVRITDTCPLITYYSTEKLMSRISLRGSASLGVGSGTAPPGRDESGPYAPPRHHTTGLRIVEADLDIGAPFLLR